jgi:hypothetical protein
MVLPMAALPSNYGYDPGFQNLEKVRLIGRMIEPATSGYPNNQIIDFLGDMD